ncbi:MAG: hypothetical protein KDC18_02935 [Alphaproteobacteria bacterium]|nr:hypothetical protein [Alphaproteobacteria bacterium]MCB9931731.1 hypothetical protein [Alphaproteobacteria bacterium]
MSLDDALKAVRHLPSAPPPDLTRLAAAANRVHTRWPDVVPDPPERDHERIIAEMRELLERDDWRDVKLSFVLRALRVAFNPNFRGRPDVTDILYFAYNELAVTTHASFFNAMVSIYIASYQPGARHSLALGQRIGAQLHLLNARWQAMVRHYPSLFDGRTAHAAIAEAMLGMESPWQQLRDQGFADPHATGLMDHVHETFVGRLRPHLNTEQGLNHLFAWLHPKPGTRKQSGSTQVIEAVLGHWLKRQPTDAFRGSITERMIGQFSDPRTNRSLWLGVREDHMAVIFRWLTREDLRFFLSVVDATQKNHQFPPRRDFWLLLYDEGLIEQAWVAFCPSAERHARNQLIRNGAMMYSGRFARQTAGGARSDTSILLMKIGSKIVVDGCHNYRTHIFNSDDPAAPQLFQPSYDCDADVRLLSPWSRPHNSIRVWSEWVRESINSRTPMSGRPPRRRVPQNARARGASAPSPQPSLPGTLSRQNEPRGDILSRTRAPSTGDHNRPPRPPEQRGTNTPPAPGAQPRQAADWTAPPPFSARAINEEAKDLWRRMILNGDRAGAVRDALEKVRAQAWVNPSERANIARAIDRNRNRDDEFVSLKAFVGPIFNRDLSEAELALWHRKAQELEHLAKQYRLISPKVSSALDALGHRRMLTSSEKNAVEHLGQRLRSQGIELLELIHGN